MYLFKKVIILIMILFYFLAGFNHFIKPTNYINLIPSYLLWPETLNYLAGFFELIFAILLIPIKTRRYASWGIILMLIAFMPTHIYMIQKASINPLELGKIKITPFIAWLRIPLQGILVIWAYCCSKMKFELI